MQLDLTNLPPAILCRAFDIIAHSSHLNLEKTACFAITTSLAHLENLPFSLMTCADNYLNSSYFTEEGTRNLDNMEPDSIDLDYVARAQSNIFLFYKFLVDVSYRYDINQIALVYDAEYSDIIFSMLAGYHILKNEEPEESVALVAVKYPSMYFDYPTVCLLDHMLECNQKLIEAVETYEVMEVAVTKAGLVTERAV